MANIHLDKCALMPIFHRRINGTKGRETEMPRQNQFFFFYCIIKHTTFTTSSQHQPPGMSNSQLSYFLTVGFPLQGIIPPEPERAHAHPLAVN